ncbi:hypothetical protein M3M33_15135, partial [Loigolactobacillus coryniformis]|uniref:hypothetical protein n=1 Tax=Loigolactobacillus coryniformis TaxID=1610 RepID=UPI00201AEA21
YCWEWGPTRDGSSFIDFLIAEEIPAIVLNAENKTDLYLQFLLFYDTQIIKVVGHIDNIKELLLKIPDQKL